MKGHNIHAALAYRHADLTHTNSASAAAAYRHAQQHGTGEQAFDYRNKIGVQWYGVIAPEHAPPWMRDPHKLWAAVDHTEHRKNARMAQEIIIALPHQVDLDKHIALLERFTRTYCVDRYGMVADIAIHSPPLHHGGDPRNVHAHIMLTDRPVTRDGFASHKDRRTSDKTLVNELRQGWTETHNRAMEEWGLPHRIDHRRLEVQRAEALQRGDIAAALDLDRTPQIHVGREIHIPTLEAQFGPKTQRNRSILLANKLQAETRKEHVDRLIAEADTATHLESRGRTTQPPRTYAELKARHRPIPTKAIDRLKEIAHASVAAEHTREFLRMHAFRPLTTADQPAAVDNSIVDALAALAKPNPAKPSVFTVTPRDMAFICYRLGFCNLATLQLSLEAIDAAHHDRLAQRKRPAANRLGRLQQLAPVPHGIYRKRLAQLNAFDARHLRSARRKHFATSIAHRSRPAPIRHSLRRSQTSTTGA